MNLASLCACQPLSASEDLSAQDPVRPGSASCLAFPPADREARQGIDIQHALQEALFIAERCESLQGRDGPLPRVWAGIVDQLIKDIGVDTKWIGGRAAEDLRWRHLQFAATVSQGLPGLPGLADWIAEYFTYRAEEEEAGERLHESFDRTAAVVHERACQRAARCRHQLYVEVLRRDPPEVALMRKATRPGMTRLVPAARAVSYATPSAPPMSMSMLMSMSQLEELGVAGPPEKVGGLKTPSPDPAVSRP